MLLGLRTAIDPASELERPHWAVGHIEAACARRPAQGAAALEPVSDAGGGIRAAAVRDPPGNRPGRKQNPHLDPPAVR